MYTIPKEWKEDSPHWYEVFKYCVDNNIQDVDGFDTCLLMNGVVPVFSDRLCDKSCGHSYEDGEVSCPYVVVIHEDKLNAHIKRDITCGKHTVIKTK